MKPFLCTDITLDKNNDTANGGEFIAARPSEVMSGALEGAAGRALETQEKAKLPAALRVVQWLCGMAGAIIALGIVKAFSRGDVTISEAYGNAPTLFWVGGICLAVWAVLRFAASRKKRSVMESDEGQFHMAKLDSVVESVMEELEVPSTAVDVDVLTFRYKTKSGEVKPKAGALDFTPYENGEYKLFSDDSTIYLADIYGKFAIPRDELIRITAVRKSISVPHWNKQEQPNSKEFKPFKLSVDKYGCTHFKPYYILEFEHCGEAWGIYFAPYDLAAFETATGLNAM